MREFVVNLPDGSEHESGASEAVKLLCSSTVNWNTGSGDASLEDMSFDGTRELQLMCRPSVGFILSYFQVQKQKRQYLFAVVDLQTRKTSSNLHAVFVGGEFRNYPAELFHTVEATTQAIIEFIELDGPPASLNWVDNLARPLAPADKEFGESY